MVAHNPRESSMRLVMMGTGPFGLPTLEDLLVKSHTVVALVTRPLRPVRGKQPAPITLMRDLANEHSVPIFDPEDVNSESARAVLTGYEADLLVVCDFGQILTAETLSTTRLGGVNLHGSLLPKYRGAAPINWAIYHGEQETGVSVIRMTPQLDAGPIIGQGSTPIKPEETAEALELRLAEIGGWLIRRAIDNIDAGRIEAMPQDASQASTARRLKKSDGQIDWSRSAEQIKNQIRAMQPWPKAFTFWHRANGRPFRLILGPVSVLESQSSDTEPGTVLEVSADRLILSTADGAVHITAVQPAGKRLLSVTEFLRGYTVQPGERFGPE